MTDTIAVSIPLASCFNISLPGLARVRSASARNFSNYYSVPNLLFPRAPYSQHSAGHLRCPCYQYFE